MRLMKTRYGAAFNTVLMFSMRDGMYSIAFSLLAVCFSKSKTSFALKRTSLLKIFLSISIMI